MSQRAARSEAAQLIGTGIEANGHYAARADDWFHAYNQQTRTDAESGSERLRDSCKRFGHSFAPDVPKRRRSFEEQLALVASGRARIVDLDAA